MFLPLHGRAATWTFGLGRGDELFPSGYERGGCRIGCQPLRPSSSSIRGMTLTMEGLPLRERVAISRGKAGVTPQATNPPLTPIAGAPDYAIGMATSAPVQAAAGLARQRPEGREQGATSTAFPGKAEVSEGLAPRAFCRKPTFRGNGTCKVQRNALLAAPEGPHPAKSPPPGIRRKKSGGASNGTATSTSSTGATGPVRCPAR